MKIKAGSILVTIVGVGAIVGYCYRGPIADIANSFIKETKYFFSINADNAHNIKVSNDSDSLTSRILSDIDMDENADEPSWDMESAAGEVFDELMTELPFIKDTGDWITEEVLGISPNEGSINNSD